MFRPALLVTALTLLPIAGMAQTPSNPQPASAEVKIEHVAGKVYMISGAGGNISALVTNDGILLVDSGKPGTSDAVLKALRTVSDKPIVMIINTHWHADHIGGNLAFGPATVIASANQRGRMEIGGTVRGKTFPPATGPSLNMVTLGNAPRIYLDDELIELQAIPASHSSTDLMVTFHKSGVIHMGDLFFNGLLPYVDSEDGGSLENLTGNSKFMFTKLSKSLKLIPGHGPVSDVSGVDNMFRMLMETAQTVRTGRRSGRKLDEIVSDPAIQKYASRAWEGVSLRQFVGMLYDEAPEQRKRDTPGPGFQPEAQPETPKKP